jgi:hypothetical protein
MADNHCDWIRCSNDKSNKNKRSVINKLPTQRAKRSGE